MRIAILYGGKSAEHEVSLRSVTSVLKNIDYAKHSVYLIGITKTGRWYVQDESALKKILQGSEELLTIEESPAHAVSVIPGSGTEGGLYCKAVSLCVDIVLPILHGTYGEDGLLQGLLEMAELPYCGCTVMSSAVAMDKEKAKLIWQSKNLPVVPFMCIKASQNEKNESEKIFCEAESEFGYPVFVKPACAGSSVGSAKANNKAELQTAVNNAFLWDETVLIEPFIESREIECSVTGNSGESLKSDCPVTAYELGEIAPTHEFYDYDAKYTDPKGANLIIPAQLDAEQCNTIKNLAKKAYSALDCSGFARVDFFLDKKSSKIYINELNTLPGFTSISMFVKMCEASGLAYSDVIELLLKQGLSRFKSRRMLLTSI
ncbi:MAG: D-alanine--D-alanine ligase family protein [Spirochaetales bacterium]